MKRLLLGFVAAAVLTVAPKAQELVVFRDYRAMAVASHRVQGMWTYLRLADGELAVLTSTILEYRKEPAGPAQASSPAAASPAQPPTKSWAPEPAPPPKEPVPQEEIAPPPEDEPPPPPEPPPSREMKQRDED